MRTAICPGSFDPITLGHLNIIRRASKIFDRVVVLITVNSGKTQPMFSIEERADMVRRAVSRYPNVTVDTSDILLAEYARGVEGAVLVKGLRAASDFEYVVVNSLPTAAAATKGKFYIYNGHRYVTIEDNGNYSWTDLGSYDIDLTGYVTEDDLDDALEDRPVFQLVTEVQMQNLLDNENWDEGVIYYTVEE